MKNSRKRANKRTTDTPGLRPPCLTDVVWQKYHEHPKRRSSIPVASVDSALKHYKEVLGFEEDFRVGDYAGVKLGKIAVHLSKHGAGEFAKPVGGSIVYIFCDEVDAYYAEVKKKGAKVKYPPQDTHYGMREFMVADLDGHHVAFGCERKTAEPMQAPQDTPGSSAPRSV